MMELPDDLREVEIQSTEDGSLEPSLVHCPEGVESAPLLVGLHTWSCDRFNQVEEMLPRCRERGWALVLPEFRGRNLVGNPRAPEAGGSRLARQGIIDALDHVVAGYPIDPSRVFLLGGSGGGHMSLLMAAYGPHRFAGISSWVPISDMAAWRGQNANYTDHVEACCGGAPGGSAAIDAEYRERSPLTHARAMVEANLCVHHGRYDQSVPYTHTWRLAQELEQLGAERFFCEIFDGGHEIRYDVAFAWFDHVLANTSAGQMATG